MAAAVGVMAQARPSRVVEANEFVLKDSAGRVRARLSMEVADRPTLTFYGKNGFIPASLAGGDEPFLVLNRAGSNEQVSLGASKTLYGLGLYDKTIRVGLSVQKGVPGLDLFDENGKRRAAITAASTGPTPARRCEWRSGTGISGRPLRGELWMRSVRPFLRAIGHKMRHSPRMLR